MITIINMLAAVALAYGCLFSLFMEGQYLLMVHYFACEEGCELCSLAIDMCVIKGTDKALMLVALTIATIVIIRILLKAINVFFTGKF